MRRSAGGKLPGSWYSGLSNELLSRGFGHLLALGERREVLVDEGERAATHGETGEEAEEALAVRAEERGGGENASESDGCVGCGDVGSGCRHALTDRTRPSADHAFRNMRDHFHASRARFRASFRAFLA